MVLCFMFYACLLEELSEMSLDPTDRLLIDDNDELEMERNRNG